VTDTDKPVSRTLQRSVWGYLHQLLLGDYIEKQWKIAHGHLQKSEDCTFITECRKYGSYRTGAYIYQINYSGVPNKSGVKMCQIKAVLNRYFWLKIIMAVVQTSISSDVGFFINDTINFQHNLFSSNIFQNKKHGERSNFSLYL